MMIVVIMIMMIIGDDDQDNIPSACNKCGIRVPILLLTPCMHLLCCGCMGNNITLTTQTITTTTSSSSSSSSSSSGSSGSSEGDDNDDEEGEDKSYKTIANRCVLCHHIFSADSFQLLQPGFEIHWKEDDDVVATAVAAMAPTAIGPQQAQGEICNDGGSSSSSSNSYGEVEKDEEVEVVEGEKGVAMNGNNDDDGSWEVVSKAGHLIRTLTAYQQQLRQHQDNHHHHSSSSSSSSMRPLKAIVFSIFNSYLNGVYAALTSKGFRVSDMKNSDYYHHYYYYHYYYHYYFYYYLSTSCCDDDD